MDLPLNSMEMGCPKCEGRGEIEVSGETAICDRCHGLGTILTAQGEVILFVVRKYF
jgi:DnaJ-class molecular chaperone